MGCLVLLSFKGKKQEITSYKNVPQMEPEMDLLSVNELNIATIGKLL